MNDAQCAWCSRITDTPRRRCSRTQGHHSNFLLGEIMFRNWMQLTHDAMLLGLESQRVMALRLMKLSRGGRAAHAEALRMFSENQRPSGSWDNAGARRLSGNCNPTLPNACQIEQAAFIKVSGR